VSVLAEVIDAAGPDLAAHAVVQLPTDRFAGQVADPARSFVLEAVHEGRLLHYGESRAFTGMDPDLRLLAGDALYALGLARLAEVGDLEAVAELADLITSTARAHAEGVPERADELWARSARALS
jgi:hypothetical protein